MCCLRSFAMICSKCSKCKDNEDFGFCNGKQNKVCKRCVADKANLRYHQKNQEATYKGRPRRDLTGLQIGTLIVTSSTRMTQQNGRWRRLWMCKCECGNTSEIEHGHLTQKLVKSCGCKRYQSGESNPLWSGHGEISGNRWDAIKRKRRNKELPFEITIEFIWDLFQKQDRKCALSGVSLSFGKTFTASLDRIDSRIGYVSGNVQWVHKDVNRMKNVYSQEYFIETCRRIAKCRRRLRASVLSNVIPNTGRYTLIEHTSSCLGGRPT